ncbi:MAG TPA: DUF2793 domain-containing protein [Flavobacteriales bacterium]|nr:DUF2793 domain-containing protein [Flavobacteriales bacterium]HMR28567.1 DUF2793 domain-containing protein [Flavobacteriales bacterium]
MTQKSRAALINDTTNKITSNNNNEITGAVLRALLIDIIDSALNLTTDGTPRPPLSGVLQEGNVTGARDIIISEGQLLRLASGAFNAGITTAALTASRTFTLPDKSGTFAMVDDVAPALTRHYHKGVTSVLTAPPGSPATGQRHMVGVGASGAWSGQDLKLAEWSGSAWVFTTPTRGDMVHVFASPTDMFWYDGTTWNSFPMVLTLPYILGLGGDTSTMGLNIGVVTEKVTNVSHTSEGPLVLDLSYPYLVVEFNSPITILDWANAQDGVVYTVVLKNTHATDPQQVDAMQVERWLTSASEVVDFVGVGLNASRSMVLKLVKVGAHVMVADARMNFRLLE